MHKFVQHSRPFLQAFALNHLKQSEQCYSVEAGKKGFPPPPLSPQRRVVVTGMPCTDLRKSLLDAA